MKSKLSSSVSETADSMKAAAFLSSLPLCMVTLDPEDLHPVAINDMFLSVLGPLFKFKNSSFVCAASDDKDSDAQARLRAAIEETKKTSARSRVRNIEMTTLAGESGFPIRKFFDWFISRTDDAIVLLGDPCTEQDVTQREKDTELIDFFQNAPIAMHWLSGEGKVLWANQTELNVLGYAAEEYIGQDIMKFCPDEKELVLEIFKQLGSGNAIKDVPVRFRTKDGKIVHLLIDSNVKYEKDGSFGHTRCFIRDDTGRKIRESRASLLLEETKRSLAMLDNFMARSLHQMRTPLHVTQAMVDTMDLYLKSDKVVPCPETTECIEMVKMANDQISSSVAFLDDVADLAKFDQGAVLNVKPDVVALESFGNEILCKVPPTRNGVQALLELRQNDIRGEGPALAVTDPKVLRRVLDHLLNNAVDVTKVGTVSLGIGYKNSRLTFSVTDTGPGLEIPSNAADGDLPTIFQRYHQELLPNETADLTTVATIRDRIESGINTHKKNGLGIGLSLTYHLVQSLGGELRCISNKGEGTTFQFSLPRKVSNNTTIPTTSVLVSSRVTKTVPAEPEDITAPHSPPSFDMPTEVIPEAPLSRLAAEGVKSQDPPSILVVEDTKACARMLCRMLSKFGCAVKWAENGQVAIDILKEATPGTYDLILMDLRMPVMDGLEATRIIKSQLHLLTPVIALTGDDNPQTRDEAKDIGFDAFYGKPTKRDDLKAIINKFTGYKPQ